MGKGAVVRTS